MARSQRRVTIPATDSNCSVRLKRGGAVKTLKLWARPALIVGFWILATSFTLSELATVGPSLRSAGQRAPQAREAKLRALGARAQSTPR